VTAGDCCTLTIEHRATLRDDAGREARVLAAAMPGRGGIGAAYLALTVPPVLGPALARELAAVLLAFAEEVEHAKAMNSGSASANAG
jgi:hypothetical protein